MLGTLNELAERVRGRVVGDGSVAIARIASVEEAGEDALTFATSEAYFVAACSSKAAAVLIDEALVESACVQTAVSRREPAQCSRGAARGVPFTKATRAVSSPERRDRLGCGRCRRRVR